MRRSIWTGQKLSLSQVQSTKMSKVRQVIKNLLAGDFKNSYRIVGRLPPSELKLLHRHRILSPKQQSGR